MTHRGSFLINRSLRGTTLTFTREGSSGNASPYGPLCFESDRALAELLASNGLDTRIVYDSDPVEIFTVSDEQIEKLYEHEC